MWYAISPKAQTNTQQKLFLTVAKEGTLQVQTYNPGEKGHDDSQLWTLTLAAGMSNPVLMNKRDGKLLQYVAENAAASIVDDSVAHETSCNSSGCCQVKLITEPGDFYAIQSQGNQGQNLNVEGNGPTYPSGTPVWFYKWGNGASNELWTFTTQ